MTQQPKELPMKTTAVLILTLGLGACAHAPEPYSFSAAQAPNDLDVVARTLKANGYKLASVDPAQATITTYWFDTGYQFREVDSFADRDRDLNTDIFLRYHVRIERNGKQDHVVIATDVQRCSPLDAQVTAAGVTGTCQPLDKVFPTQQHQVNALGDKLRQALASRS
jgi:hypothetical protein